MKSSYFKKISVFFIVLGLTINVHSRTRGTETGGGGDLTPYELVDKYAVDTFIKEELSLLVRLFLSYSDVSMNTSMPCLFAGTSIWSVSSGDMTQLSLQACKKMYLSSPTIFEILPQIQFRLQDESCKDPQTGLDKDASLNGLNVCFSTNRLLPKLNKDNFQKSLIALAVHEVSHYLHTSEEEAQFIELIAKRNIILTENTGVKLYLRQIQENFDMINALINLLESNNFSKNKNCLIVQDISSKFESISANKQQLQDHGFRFFNSFNWLDDLALFMKVGNAKTYCNSIIDASEIDANNLLNFIFKPNENEISVVEYFKRFPQTGSYRNLNSQLGSIKNLSTGDRLALIKELKDFSVLTKKMYNLN